MAQRKWTPTRVVALIVLWLFVMMGIFPLLWMLVSSFKTNMDFLLKPFGLPTHVTFENYRVAWRTGSFPRYFTNSGIVALMSLVLMIGTGAMVAFALARYRSVRYRNRILFFFVIGQMISGQVIIISIYLVLNRLGLLDKALGLALVYAASGLPFVVFMLSGFFKTIPYELYEAGMIDGYNEWRIFANIAVPLARPSIATALIIQFLYVWNEFTIAYITTRTPTNYTVPVGIYMTVNDVYSTSYTAACAGLVITAVPTLLVYALFQKQIVYGISSGAVKG
ncbi:MAG: carbohydrate ABC transporter permease [Christensenellaceae bacterium]|nr:carbohydrate ABC transporter permease [Christensenellaceae bacterium]